MDPLIGISCNCSSDQNVTLNMNYIQAVISGGGVPILLPLICMERIPTYLSLLDGLLLSGGGDIVPILYGRNDPSGLAQNLNLQRDYFELALLSWAIAQGLPVLGICRGMQLINLYCQGTFFLDLDNELNGVWLHHAYRSGGETTPRPDATHPVRFTPGSGLSRIYGELALVNSSHHQSVRKIGSGLSGCAASPDGVVEAIEGKGQQWLVGVQWHPEKLLANPSSLRLFQEFVRESVCYSKRKKFSKKITV